MRKFFSIALLGIAGVLWGADWSSQSGNPQRDGWARSEANLVKSKIQGLKLLYKTKLDNQSRGLDSLTSPIIISNLITYLGFKELLFVGGSSDSVYAIDAALNRPFWQTHFTHQGDVPEASPTATCPGGLTASIAITGGSGPMGFNFHTRPRAPGSPGVGPGQGGAAQRPAKTPDRPVSSSGLFSSGFGRNGYVFAIGGDGYLRFVRQSDGNDTDIPPVKFVPPNSKVTSINVSGTVVYAATVDGCGGSPNALYAVDLGGGDHNVVSFQTNGSGLSGKGGTAVGNDGTVYAQVAQGHGEVAGNYGDTVLAMDPGTLKVRDYFTPDEHVSSTGAGGSTPGITPAVFPWKSKDLIVAAGQDGAVYLLDSASLGGSDHHTPLAKTEPMTGRDVNSPHRGMLGDFATWEDTDTGARWIYAAVQGGPSSDAKFPLTNGSVESGSIVAFKVEEQNGKPTLTAQWVSRDLIGPVSPVTTNGMVFALATGKASGMDSGAQADHATMYVLDGATGKELFSTGKEVTAFSHGSGLAIANDRVYFTTHDNTVYCYGFPALEPQLWEH